MSKVQTVFDFLSKVSIGVIAAAAYVESVNTGELPPEIHAIAAILVILCNAFNVAVQAVEDKETS